MTTSQPSLRSANWLYLSTMGLILLLGSLMQARSMSWGLLATEFGLILLPTLLFIWRGRLDWRAVLRWRWPGARLVALGALIGAGTWGLDMGLQGVAATVLGYTPASSLTSLRTDPLNLAVFAFAMVIAAPLCEEALFRGYLLSAYSRYRPAVRLVMVGLLFALYHLQGEGLIALLPIALVLGVLAHRSRSLAPGIAAHMANNTLGAAVAIATRLNPTLPANQAFTVALCSAMVAGPLLALAALAAYLALTRTPHDATEGAAASVSPAPGLRRGTWWPLAGAAVIYLAVAGLEVAMGRFPQVLARPALQLQPAPWTEPLRLRYNLWNVENKSVGSVRCTFTPQAQAVAFDCLSRQQHFEAQLGQSFYAGGTYALTQSGRWDAASMRLLDADLRFEGEFSSWTARVEPSAEAGLNVWLNDAAPTTVPADAVLAGEWPFRLMALPLGSRGYFGSRFSQVLIGVGQDTGALEEAVVVVRGEEDLPTPPDGHAAAWKVQVGQQTAWYTAATPHLLLRYNDGLGVTWTVDLASLPDSGN
jgi:membrane protease YdiL (CAAX protease family)